ncbi:MAG TPA: DEAD/DEAH box helicase [Rhodospirillaceae bacterium]|nr:DEAD/DEAH box helicase [Rhodospirillaceae bacterium]
MTSFIELGLLKPICEAVAREGYSQTTPIQQQAIPTIVAGRDVLGVAQTGTGKTAAFALPILHRLAENRVALRPRRVRALILTPTRELAVQVGQCFGTYGALLRLKRVVVTGGVGMQPQIAALHGGTDILVATPGRLLDLMARGAANLDAVECFVLDEADRMLDMGFINDIRKIVGCLPVARQTLLFSATMPPMVGSLAATILKDHQRIEVTPAATTVDRVDQRVMFVAKDRKRDLLLSLLKSGTVSRAIVFARTKHGANRLAEQLEKSGISAEAIHGNKSQGARQRALSEFQAGRVIALVATDIAARGIHVDDVSHVINYELPNEPESYVHRIGRTARAGAEGIALSFCDSEEIAYLRAIEATIRQPVPADEAHPFHCPATARMRLNSAAKPPKRMGGGGNGQRPRGRPQNGRRAA